MTERIHFHFSLSCFGEGNGNPLQCSCLENPRGGGAWWAAVYGVSQSQTRLKRLSSSSSNHGNQKKKKKRVQIEREVKLSLFAVAMILYLENSKDATRKLLELINGSGKPAGHRSNAQKDPAFLNTNNKRSEREVEEIIPSITATKEQEMATHSSILAWEIPWTEVPSGL